LYILTREKNC